MGFFVDTLLHPRYLKGKLIGLCEENNGKTNPKGKVAEWVKAITC